MYRKPANNVFGLPAGSVSLTLPPHFQLGSRLELQGRLAPARATSDRSPNGRTIALAFVGGLGTRWEETRQARRSRQQPEQRQLLHYAARTLAQEERVGVL